MKLEIKLFDQEPQNYQIDSSTVSVGRSSQCDVVINHESMSRKHCLIEVESGKIFITDLGSTNGVSIDGNRITPNEKTFYLNSLPLMIGAANVTVDISDYQTQMINLAAEGFTSSASAPNQAKSTTGSFTKTTPTAQTTSRGNNTATKIELETRSKPKTSKTTKRPKTQMDESKKREILMALLAILAFVIMGAWYITKD